MTVQISIMLAYQAFSGVLYQRIVLLTAAFMAGTAAGAMGAALVRAKGYALLVLGHAGIALVAMLVPLWLWLSAGQEGGVVSGTAGFILLSTACGFLTGMYYRAVVDSAWPGSDSAVPALFYSWDMFGACIGGILAGTFLVPVSGMTWTAIMVASVHFVAAVFLAPKIPDLGG
jgi:hypothetical protein